MSGKIEEVLAAVLKRVEPKAKERAEIEALASKLEQKVASAAKSLDIDATVRVEGSVAKDTWLSGEPDVDVFMRLSSAIPRTKLGQVCLKVAKKATRESRQVERFAEHPYLEAFVDGTRVNVVPCYISKPMEWLSATDRTPYHTDYVNERLTGDLRGQVRLLKKFMNGTGVYGAEIKIGGFSGYLCELLILHYRSFLNVTEAFAQHKQRIVIDIEGYYKDRQGEIDLLFDEPLVVVDPVDRARNVASAVRREKLWSFVAASQAFLKKPDLKFFYPPETSPLSVREVKQALEKRGSAIVFVVFSGVRAVPDILWGQLYKSQRGLRRLLEINDFTVLRELPWSDEEGLNMFVFELENCRVSSIKLHLGPPLDKVKECERFIMKHSGSKVTVAGPLVQDGRWVVLVKRKYNDARLLLNEMLRDGGRRAGVAEGISKVLKKDFKVLANEEIIDVYRKSRDFSVFLTEFLSGKPKWLETE